MTDKEIIKALECCISPECENCPYDGDDLLRPCNHNLMKDTLNLINRQQAELSDARISVKSYKGKYESAVKTAKELQDVIKEQRAEIERLTIETMNMAITIETCQAEAIKEFAERLKYQCPDFRRFGEPHDNYYRISQKQIDNLVKEMVGEG